MIPSYQNRDIQTSGIEETREFGISLDDSAHIMTILRDTLYSDKVLAVLREYSANAWDSHKEAGKKDVPIKVTMPTKMEPTLIIEDFGVGLSHDDVFQVYTQYGKSTKRGSNEAVGQLGIGSKSGFAYSDSFTIVSSHGGVRRTYVALLDESEKGNINLLLQEPCGDDTGVAIHIPVRPEDIGEFQDKARQLFQFFNPRPKINLELPLEPPVERRLKNGIIYEQGSKDKGNWKALMGCIPYTVNVSQLDRVPNILDADDLKNRERSGLGPWVNNLSGILYFGIGEVHISASREELKYSKSTKRALVDKLNNLVDEFVQVSLATIESESISNWERRIRLQVLRRLDMPIPKGYSEMAKHSIVIQSDPINTAKTFYIAHTSGNEAKSLDVSSDTRLLIQDDNRKLVGFRFDGDDHLVIRRRLTEPDALNPDGTYASWEDVRTELAHYIVDIKADGIPVGLLSTVPWDPPYVKPKKPRAPQNAKHYQKYFVLKDGFRIRHPYSGNWNHAPTGRAPTPEDVFVILKGFQTDYEDKRFNIYSWYSDDAVLATSYKMTMPTIYAYKTTKAKPLTEDKCVGIYYPKWRQKFLEELAQRPEVQKDLMLYDWQRIYRDKFRWGDKPNTKLLVDSLGKDHTLVQYLIRAQRSNKKWEKIKHQRQVTHLYTRLYTGKKSDADLQRDELFKRYPLLALERIGLEALWENNSKQWLDYVKLIDLVLPMNIMQLTPVPEEEQEQLDDDD